MFAAMFMLAGTATALVLWATCPATESVGWGIFAGLFADVLAGVPFAMFLYDLPTIKQTERLPPARILPMVRGGKDAA